MPEALSIFALSQAAECKPRQEAHGCWAETWSKGVQGKGEDLWENQGWVLCQKIRRSGKGVTFFQFGVLHGAQPGEE